MIANLVLPFRNVCVVSIMGHQNLAYLYDRCMQYIGLDFCRIIAIAKTIIESTVAKSSLLLKVIPLCNFQCFKVLFIT